jgi:4-amino-4-deoxy-L-arabinose transferase-like glycosyltransferase
MVAIVALAIRLTNVLVWRPTCDQDLLAVARAGGAGDDFDPAGGQAGCFAIWGDTAYSYLQGRLIAEGHWFVDSYRWFLSGGTALHASSGDPPLFALWLAALARVGLASGTAMRVAMAVVGVGGVIAIALLARRLAGPRAGIIAGGLAALHPMLWINDGMLLSESLYVPILVAALFGAYRFWDRPGLRRAVVLGALCGLAALVRAEALILLAVVPAVLVWALDRASPRPASRTALARLAAVAVAAGLVVVAPWLAYNLTRFERPALMTSMTGAVLSSASCDRTYGGELIGYYATCFEDHIRAGGLVDGRPPCPAGPAPDCWYDDPTADETVRDGYRSRYAMDYMRANLGRLPVVVAARVGRIWDLYTPELGSDVEPLGQNVRLNWQLEGRGQRASQAGLLVFWAMLPLAALGTVRLARDRVPIGPLVALVVVITVTGAVTFGVTRYRVPLDVVVVVLAAIGSDALVSRRWPSRWLPPPLRRRGSNPARPADRPVEERV